MKPEGFDTRIALGFTCPQNNKTRNRSRFDYSRASPCRLTELCLPILRMYGADSEGEVLQGTRILRFCAAPRSSTRQCVRCGGHPTSFLHMLSCPSCPSNLLEDQGVCLSRLQIASVEIVQTVGALVVLITQVVLKSILEVARGCCRRSLWHVMW